MWALLQTKNQHVNANCGSTSLALSGMKLMSLETTNGLGKACAIVWKLQLSHSRTFFQKETGATFCCRLSATKSRWKPKMHCCYSSATISKCCSRISFWGLLSVQTETPPDSIRKQLTDLYSCCVGSGKETRIQEFCLYLWIYLAWSNTRWLRHTKPHLFPPVQVPRSIV